MRWMFYITSGLAIISLAYWAYAQNYQTQAALKEARALQIEIGELRERLAVLRAEWAYLNRPDNLRELALANFDKLGLFPLTPEQFGKIDEIGFPSDLGYPRLGVDLAAILEGEQ